MIEFYRLFSSFFILMTTFERVNLRPFLSLSKLPSDSHRERWRRKENKGSKKERSLMWFDKALVGFRSLFIDNKLLFWRVYNARCAGRKKNRKIKPLSFLTVFLFSLPHLKKTFFDIGNFFVSIYFNFCFRRFQKEKVCAWETKQIADQQKINF